MRFVARYLSSKISNVSKYLPALFAFSLLVRAIIAYSMALGVDESYAVSISRIFSLSYFDHPPLGFWMARWSSILSGSETPIIVRFPFLILSTGSILLVFKLTEYLFGEKAGLWAAAWFSVTPFFLISAGSWVVPDGPLIFFLLSTSLLVMPLIIEDKPSHVWIRWILGGGAFGLALLSKYQSVLYAVGGLIIFITTDKGKRWLLHPGPYIAGVISCLIFSPVLIWNMQHDWISFSFQAGRAVSSGGWTYSDGMVNFVRMVLGQILYLSPGIFFVSVYVALVALKKGAFMCFFLDLCVACFAFGSYV